MGGAGVESIAALATGGVAAFSIAKKWGTNYLKDTYLADAKSFVSDVLVDIKEFFNIGVEEPVAEEVELYDYY